MAETFISSGKSTKRSLQGIVINISSPAAQDEESSMISPGFADIFCFAPLIVIAIPPSSTQDG